MKRKANCRVDMKPQAKLLKVNHIVDMEQVQCSRRRTLRALAACLLLVLLFHRTSWAERSSLPYILVWLGMFLITLAICGRIWTRIYLGERKRSRLVYDGPYSLVRHPLYMFSIIGADGIGAQTQSLAMMTAITLLVWLLLRRTAKIEEADMTTRFGEAYQVYLADRRRFWPRFSLWKPGRRAEIDPAMLADTLFDSSMFALAPAVFWILRWAHAGHFIPWLFQTP